MIIPHPRTLEEIKEVLIDTDREFKFILVDIVDRVSGEIKTIIRGFQECKYHMDILNKFTH